MFFIRCPEPALAIANNFANRWWNDCLKTMPNLCSKKHALQMGNWCTFDRGNLTGTGAVVEQYTACFVCNVWKQSSLAYNTCPPFYIYLLYMICYCSIQAQSTALATPRAMVCCLKLLSATFGNAEVFHAPMGWWKASTMFFGADAFNQSIGAWNMSAVTNMGGCSMELLPTQQIGAWNASAVTGAVVGQYTACFVCNVWKQSSLAYNTCPPFYIDLLYMINYCSIQAQSTALATPRAMVCCLKLLSATFGNAEVFHAPMGWWKASTMFFGADAFNQSIGAWNTSAVTDMESMLYFAVVLNQTSCSLPMCPRSWWIGGRQAPCSLVLMPSTSPLGPGTCQQWPTWGDVPWSKCHHPAEWCLECIGSDWCGGGTVYCMLCIQCLKTKLPGIQYSSSLLHIFIIHDLLLQYSGAKYSSRNSSRYGLLSEVAFSNLWQCWSVPCPNGLVEGKHHVLWCWCLQPVHWGLEHVSSDQHGGMFHGATATTPQIGAWNASAVTDMESMLYSAVVLNQTSCSLPMCPKSWWTGPRQAPCSLVLMPSTSPLGPGICQQWPTLFRGANASNQPIGAWNTSAVTDMESMLYSAVVLNQTSCSLPMCPKSWWTGPRQAPCSLVLMPSNSPLGPGTCQQWPTWGDVPWSKCHHPAEWCLECIGSDWCGGGTVYCMLCIQCLKTKLPGILPPFYIYLLYMICYCSIQAQVQLPQLLALWFAVWSCFRQPLAMLECSMPQWAGGRQAPCSLVLMPSTSPCWSSLEFKSLNDLTTWGLRPKGWLQLTPTVHTTKDWWTSNVGMQSVLALSKWLGGFLFMSFMYANVTL